MNRRKEGPPSCPSWRTADPCPGPPVTSTPTEGGRPPAEPAGEATAPARPAVAPSPGAGLTRRRRPSRGSATPARPRPRRARRPRAASRPGGGSERRTRATVRHGRRARGTAGAGGVTGPVERRAGPPRRRPGGGGRATADEAAPAAPGAPGEGAPIEAAPTARARPQGQVGRALPGVRPRPAERHPDRHARGPDSWSSTTSPGRPTRPPRSTATSTGAGSRTCCPAWRRPSSTSASPRTPSCTEATSATTATTSRAGAATGPQPRIEEVLQAGPDHPVPGHQEPDRRQGGPAHPGGLPARALRRARPEQRAFGISKRLGRQRAPPAPQDRRRGPAGRARPHRPHRGRGGQRRRAAPRRRRPARAVGVDRGRGRPRPDAPGLLYREPDLAVRILREELNSEYRGVIIDDLDLYEQVRDYVAHGEPRAGRAGRALRHRRREPLPIFERYHVHEQLHKALDRKVWLPSGGSLDHRADRGPDGHRREHRQERRQDQPRRDGLPQQPRGGRGGGPPAAAARHRRDHRHRLHRHGGPGEPGQGGRGPARPPWPGTRPGPRSSTSPSWAWSR